MSSPSKKRRTDPANVYRAAWREVWQVCANLGNSEVMVALEKFRMASIALSLRKQHREVIQGWPVRPADAQGNQVGK
jgi:hypothetical protein